MRKKQKPSNKLRALALLQLLMHVTGLTIVLQFVVYGLHGMRDLTDLPHQIVFCWRVLRAGVKNYD